MAVQQPAFKFNQYGVVLEPNLLPLVDPFNYVSPFLLMMTSALKFGPSMNSIVVLFKAGAKHRYKIVNRGNGPVPGLLRKFMFT